MTVVDKEIVERQIGRKLTFPFFVAVRCRYGCPVVIASAPLWKGKPFPTVFWLTCPVLSKAVGTLESHGFQDSLTYEGGDRGFLFMRLYLAGVLGVKEKIQFYPKWGRIAGERLGHIKCLHAHLGAYLATGDGPGKFVWYKVREEMEKCNGPEVYLGISKVRVEEG